jgi:phosphate transport system permease protein
MPSVAERFFAGVSRACAFLVAVVPLAAFAVLSWTAVSAFLVLRAEPGAGAFAATIVFTAAVCASAAILGGAVGIGCAVAAEELAPPAVRGAIDAAIAFLGAIPAVAFGWFAYTLIVPLAARQPLGAGTPFAAATLVLAAMTAPTACILVKRALRRIPDVTRHAAAAAGASRLQTTALVVVPALRSRIAAALLAAFARALGEATAMQILLSALARHGVESAATTASWVFSTLVTAPPSAAIAGEVSTGALALFVVVSACALLVAREYRGLQWA